MIFIAALLCAAVEPAVVQLGQGSGVVLSPDGLVLTTRKVYLATPRPVAGLRDGGTVSIAGLVEEDVDRDLTVLQLDLDGGEIESALRAKALPALGSAVTVVTANGSFAATLSTLGDEVELSVPDAGEVAGAAVFDANGAVIALMRGPGHAVAVAKDAQVDPEAKVRVRNLGISAAFFLGLAVWWVYRSRAVRKGY